MWPFEHSVTSMLERAFPLLVALAMVAAAFRLLLRWQKARHARELQRIEQAGLDITDRELWLAAKLLQTLHLSVSERQELPGGVMRLSALISAARTELARTPYLPARRRPSDAFEGVLLERREEAYWVHKRHEVGVGRFSAVVSAEARDLKDAVQQYVDACGRTEIDGVPIDDDS